MRYPGTIVIEILDPVPPGLPRAEARQLIQERIETRLRAADRGGPRGSPIRRRCARLAARSAALTVQPRKPDQPLRLEC